MNHRLLSAPFTTSGEWYLPDAPGRKIAGNLHYTPERIELNLNEAFFPLRGDIGVGSTLREYPVVYGITSAGEAVTLLNSQRAGMSLNFGSGGLRQSERLLASLLLIGGQVPTNFSYPKMSFRIPGLSIWLCRPIIERVYEATAGKNGVSYHIQDITKESTRVPAIGANLDWVYSLQEKNDRFTSLEITAFAWVTIRPDTTKPIDWYFEKLSALLAMLAFLVDSPMSPDAVQASIGGTMRDVDVLLALRDRKCCEHTASDDFFMLREGMGVALETVVTKWFEVYPKIKMPSQLALSLLASEKLWLHVEFLSFLQALEGFHRGLFPGVYMDNGYEAIQTALAEALPSNISSDHRDALLSRIRYGNQISLRKRLDALAQLLPEQIRTSILGDDGKIPRNWIDTRNYYTHWDEELRDNVLDSEGMYKATVRMRHFLRALYINLMGIPQEAILVSLGNACGASQHLIQLNAANRKDRPGVFMTITEQKTGEEDRQPDIK